MEKKPLTPQEEEQLTVAKIALETMLEAIAAAGEEGIPSGHLYAMLMPYGMKLDTYQTLLGMLKKAGRVKEINHVLTVVKKDNNES